MKRCIFSKGSSEEEEIITIQEACKNGSKCRYHRENRCNFSHEESSQEKWEKVHPRRPRQFKSNNNKVRQDPRPRSVQRQEPRQHMKESRQEVREPRQKDRESKQDCRNGKSCIYHKYNKCNFLHEQPSKAPQKRLGDDGMHRGPSDQLKQCKFGHKCDKGVRCGFLHLPSDFLPQQGRRRNL